MNVARMSGAISGNDYKAPACRYAHAGYTTNPYAVSSLFKHLLKQRLRTFQPVGWVEPLRNPSRVVAINDGFRFRLRSSSPGGRGRSTHPTSYYPDNPAGNKFLPSLFANPPYTVSLLFKQFLK